MTISLEHLADGSVSDRNFQRLMSLVVDTGGRSVGVRFGSDTATWPGGAAFTNSKSVTHGLGRAPVFVAVVPTSTAVVGFVVPVVTAKGAMTFTMFFETNNGGLPAAASSVTFDWFVLG